MKLKLLIPILLTCVVSVFGQHSTPKKITAYFYDQPIKVDGVLNESCWSEAIAIDNFTQREQNEGEPATEKTKIAVVYNTNQLYFGIWCYDSDAEKISAQKMNRDFRSNTDDNLEIMISTFDDDRNGYLFMINPNGAMTDVWVGDEGKEWNKDWNTTWDASVIRNEKGWFAEIIIPFSSLKFKNEKEQIWGINFERNIKRKNEQVLWQGWSRLYDVERISQGGKLVGINNIKQGTKIELKPFLLGGFEISDSKVSTTKKIGGEINYDVAPTLKLNLTLNTDFAQVESDRKKINLSRFSMFYPEKRQFFLEGKNYFDMNIGRTKLFYSRRIGIDQSQEVPIIGGLRFFGKLHKTGIGLMSIQTYEKDSVPTSNYSVIKLKQDIFKQSNLGFIATQKYTKGHYNQVFGANFNYSSSKIFGNKNLLIGGTLAGSNTNDTTEEISNKDNLAYNVFLSYPNDIVEFDFGYTAVQEGFNPEMGYVRRKNYQMIYTELQFNPRFKKLGFFRNFMFKPLDINYFINNETKKMESVFYEWRPLGFVTKNGDFLELNILHLYDRPEEEFKLFEDVSIPAGSYWDHRVEIQSHSFGGRKIAASGAVNIGSYYTGNRQQYRMYARVSFNKHLSKYWCFWKKE